jgi:hypothetical protein
MRSRIIDGIVIVLVGLIGLTVAARSLGSVMPGPTAMDHSAAHRHGGESRITPHQEPASA